jgi:hypothetical protein
MRQVPADVTVIVGVDAVAIEQPAVPLERTTYVIVGDPLPAVAVATV